MYACRVHSNQFVQMYMRTNVGNIIFPIYKLWLNFALFSSCFHLLAEAAQNLQSCIPFFPLEIKEENCGVARTRRGLGYGFEWGERTGGLGWARPRLGENPYRPSSTTEVWTNHPVYWRFFIAGQQFWARTGNWAIRRYGIFVLSKELTSAFEKALRPTE